jgi:hypothetical protein
VNAPRSSALEGNANPLRGTTISGSAENNTLSQGDGLIFPAAAARLLWLCQADFLCNQLPSLLVAGTLDSGEAYFPEK